MPRFKLNPKKNIHDSLFFWLQQYTKFKVMTLSFKNASDIEIKKLKTDIEFVEDFKELHELMKKHKKKTSAYEYFIKNYYFVNWLIENNIIENMEDIDTYLVVEFLTEKTSNLAKSTMENYKNAVINFLKFIEDNIYENFSFKLKVSKWQSNLYRLKDKRPDYLTEEEIDRLLDAIEKHKFIRVGRTNKEDLYLKAKYRLAIQLALFGGLRISEIASLREKDLYINKKEDLLEIFIEESKNQKSRIVHIPYSQGKYSIKRGLDDFFEKRKYFLNKMENKKCELIKEGYLFISYYCNKINSPVMEYVLKRLFFKARIMTTKTGMHLLRHSHASLFYKKTQDVLLLKERLGHDNIRTTMRYTHLDIEKAKKSANALR